MARTVLTDNIWEQLQTTMKNHGCHQWKNNRNVMEGILWKLRTGVPWRDVYFIADKGYDSQAIRDKAIEHGMKAVIPKRKNAKQPNLDFDSYLYKLRHLVENMFARLKHFRSIATRYEKLVRNFKSMLYLACSLIHCKLN